MSQGLGLGFLLNLVFWIGWIVVSVFVGAWAALEWFPGAAREVRRVRGRLGRKRSSTAPETVGPVEEPRYRKAS